MNPSATLAEAQFEIARQRWAHCDAEVTPLYLAAAQGHTETVHVLLAAGANPGIRYSKHDSDATGCAEFFKQPHIVEVLKAHTARA